MPKTSTDLHWTPTSLRGAKRRSNPVTPKLQRDCFVGLRPPRNDAMGLSGDSQTTLHLSLDHGGDKARWCEYFQIPIDQAIDFSASINPLGYPPELEPFLTRRLPVIQHYPDRGSEKVRDSLARYLQIPSDYILVGNGSMELIDLVLRALKFETVTIKEPAFSEYRRLAQINGATVREEDSGNCVFVGNPGNPKGDLLGRDDFKKLLDLPQVPFLVIDEAFVEFAGEENSFAREVPNQSRLIVIRSATKFFALPGLRLGYLIADPDIVSELSKVQLPWSVNVLAQEAIPLVLDDKNFQEKSRQFVESERSWLSGKLEGLGWIKPYPSQANFILCEILNPIRDALDLFESLGRKGIFIRPCHNFEGLGPRFFRIAVRTRPENERLLKAL